MSSGVGAGGSIVGMLRRDAGASVSGELDKTALMANDLDSTRPRLTATRDRFNNRSIEIYCALSG